MKTMKKEKSSEVVLLLAFAAVYVLWGSTYLALHFVLESMPPFLMAAFRFTTAGAIMLLVAKLTKHSWPSSFGSVEKLNPMAIIALFTSSISWAVGSVFSGGYFAGRRSGAHYYETRS